MSGGTEGAMWGLMRGKGMDRLPGNWHRVENRVDPGMPDLHFSWFDHSAYVFRTGWIELKTLTLKHIDRTKILNVAHFRPAQRFWLRSYAASGGFGAMFLRIEADGEFKYALIPGRWAADHVGVDASWNKLLVHSAVAWAGKWDRNVFLQGLVRCHDHLRAY